MMKLDLSIWSTDNDSSIDFFGDENDTKEGIIIQHEEEEVITQQVETQSITITTPPVPVPPKPPIADELLPVASSLSYPSLTEMAVRMANYSTPPESPSWKKNRKVLLGSNRFHLTKTKRRNDIFSSVTDNIVELLTSYGLTQFDNATVDSDIANNDVIVVEMLVHSLGGNQCRGSQCDTIPRIVIQAEQVRNSKLTSPVYKYLIHCHESPTCVVWDFSDSNFDWLKSINASDSCMLVPHMFHSRFKSLIPPGPEGGLVPLHNRSMDVTFFGLITRRRKWFHEKNFDPQRNGTLSAFNIRFEKNMNVHTVAKAYADSKICLTLHSYYPDSAGEYHRLSEMNRFGCIVIMESFQDTLLEDTLSRFGGVIFASHADLPGVIERELEKINGTSFEELNRHQNAVDKWWEENEIQWNGLLEKILGPRE